MNLDAFYLVKLIFGKYFCYFDTNRVVNLQQLHLQLGAICIPVHERVNLLTIDYVFKYDFLTGDVNY